MHPPRFRTWHILCVIVLAAAALAAWRAWTDHPRVSCRVAYARLALGPVERPGFDIGDPPESCRVGDRVYVYVSGYVEQPSVTPRPYRLSAGHE